MREDGKLDYLEMPGGDLPAVKTFYAALSPDQRTVFDALMRLRGGHGGIGHGHMGHGRMGGRMGPGGPGGVGHGPQAKPGA